MLMSAVRAGRGTVEILIGVSRFVMLKVKQKLVDVDERRTATTTSEDLKTEQWPVL